MRNAWRILTVAGLAGAAVTSFARAQDDTRARKLMEEAFNHRYRWGENLKSFSADFTLTREGKSVKGSLKADVTQPHGSVSVECDDPEVKKLVSDTIGSTVTHTRASSFEKGFGSCTFSIAGDGVHGGTKLALSGHGFFKDFTVKDGTIVENHGGHGEMSSEVKVHQVVWLAECGKTLPRAYSFKIKTGDHEQSGKNVESWTEVEGVWLPARFHMARSEGSTAPAESMLVLENIKVEK
jgi:Protein of unknown function (DUF3386)